MTQAKRFCELDANARLIAAAPETAAERDRLKATNAELLAVLAPILGAAEIDCLDDSSNVWRSLMLEARAALAKAKG